MTALALAQERRLARSKLRVEVAAMSCADGRARLAGLIEDPPECVLTLPVGDALMWVRRMGRHNMRRSLRELGGPMSEGVAVGFLTPRQRRMLVEWLRAPR